MRDRDLDVGRHARIGEVRDHGGEAGREGRVLRVLDDDVARLAVPVHLESDLHRAGQVGAERGASVAALAERALVLLDGSNGGQEQRVLDPGGGRFEHRLHRAGEGERGGVGGHHLHPEAGAVSGELEHARR